MTLIESIESTKREIAKLENQKEFIFEVNKILFYLITY